MRLLSHNYQGLPPPDSAPIFTKHVFPDPSAELVHEYLPSMPHLAQTYPHAALGTAYAQMNRTTERIDLHIEGHKLHSLRERVMGHLKGTGVQLSIQDCLTAYLVTALNRCLGDPIHEITNAASYRHLPLPFVDGNVVGNAIYIVRIIPTRLSKGSLSLCDVAVAIRSTLERCRTSEYVEWWMCVASHIMLAAANEDRSLFFSTPLGRLSVNSNTA
ncbi:hypothetical protein OBBRIDRAFT_720887 [Obba rivulosa]|uniref:Uncharacterized protein n=1 Tax=Obba rivulosa TaxID=1052685 RepID=A0A8E2DTE7_9APHY|nr:hypothetical protein OBBRIDRAFT_720887 [Obba rivulosa]